MWKYCTELLEQFGHFVDYSKEGKTNVLYSYRAIAAVSLGLQYGQDKERWRQRGEALQRGKRRALHNKSWSQSVFWKHLFYLVMSQEQGLRRLRFTKEVVTNLEPHTSVRMFLSVAVEVTITLRFYAIASFQV